MARFDLTDTEWTIIAPLLPGTEGRKNGRPRPDDRKVINGIFFVCAPALPGVICRSAMGPTQPCTTGSIVGRRRASGFEYSRPWRRVSCRPIVDRYQDPVSFSIPIVFCELLVSPATPVMSAPHAPTHEMARNRQPRNDYCPEVPEFRACRL